MIDPATGWFEIVEIPDKKSVTISNLVEQTWLSRYPRPEKCIFDNGGEFIGLDFQGLLADEAYGIKPKPVTVKNPQANSMLERIHQVLANFYRTYKLEERQLDRLDLWSGTLVAVAWAICLTYHTT